MNLWQTNYFTRGFWGDEAWTVLISRLSLGEILKITGQDFHPPAYYFLVHWWGNTWGWSEVAVRSLSLFFFLLTLILVYFFAQKLKFAKLPSILASFLILLSPILFTYAFEARSYALLTFLSVLVSFIFWLSLAQKSKVWKLAYFLVGALGIYSHYYFWFVLFSHGIYVLLFERKKLLSVLAPAIGIALAQLPWLPVFLSQINSVSNSYWIAPINARTHYEFFLRVAGGDHVTIWQKPASLLIFGVIIYGLITKFAGKKIKQNTLFLLTWLIVPTLIPSLISLKTPIFFYRYLIFSSVPLLLLFVSSFKNKKTLLVFSGALLFMYGLVSYSKFTRSPFSMREKQKELVTQGKITNPSYTVLPKFAEVYYYLGDEVRVSVIPEGLVQFSGLSLLKAYQEKGLVEIKEPTEKNYLLIKDGLEIEYVHQN